jgi:hypothetical protein
MESVYDTCAFLSEGVAPRNVDESRLQPYNLLHDTNPNIPTILYTAAAAVNSNKEYDNDKTVSYTEDPIQWQSLEFKFLHKHGEIL